MAAIAQWLCLHLLSHGPGFEPQAHHPSLFQFVLLLLEWEKNDNKRKRASDWPIFFKKDKYTSNRIGLPHLPSELTWVQSPVVDVIKLFLQESLIYPKLRNLIKFVMLYEPAQKCEN